MLIVERNDRASTAPICADQSFARGSRGPQSVCCADRDPATAGLALSSDAIGGDTQFPETLEEQEESQLAANVFTATGVFTSAMVDYFGHTGGPASTAIEPTFGTSAHFGIAQLTTSSGQVYNLNLDPHKTQLRGGDVVTVQLANEQTGISLAADGLTQDTSSVSANPFARHPDFLATSQWNNVVSVVSGMREGQVVALDRPSVAAAVGDGNRDMLIIRVCYLDSCPTYCDENCVRSGMWTAGRNVDGMFRESSYNRIAFPQNMGTIVTVTVNQNASDLSGCPFTSMADDADAVLRAGSGPNPDTFIHKAYFIPSDSSIGCRWGGLAYVNTCQSLGQTSRRYCRSWVRSARPTTLAHEIGHNLGTKHDATDAGDDGNQDCEYCGHDGFMGNDYRFAPANAPHRMRLNWLTAATTQLSGTCADATTFSLAALHTDPVAANSAGMSSIVLLPRSQDIGGGEYYLSFRNSEGYDGVMDATYRNRVSLHYAKTSTSNVELVRWFDGSTVCTPAGTSQTCVANTAGVSGTLPAGTFTVSIISVSSSHAVVSLSITGCSNTPSPTNAPPSNTCCDESADCGVWAKRGYCATGSPFRDTMVARCGMTCNTCGDTGVADPLAFAPEDGEEETPGSGASSSGSGAAGAVVGGVVVAALLVLVAIGAVVQRDRHRRAAESTTLNKGYSFSEDNLESARVPTLVPLGTSQRSKSYENALDSTLDEDEPAAFSRHSTAPVSHEQFRQASARGTTMNTSATNPGAFTINSHRLSVDPTTNRVSMILDMNETDDVGAPTSTAT